MHKLDTVPAKGSIPEMPDKKFPGKGQIPVDPLRIKQLFVVFQSFLPGFPDFVKNVLDGVLSGRPETGNILLTRVEVDFDVHNPGTILAPVVLLFHKKVKLIKAILPGSVFFVVKGCGFEQSDQGNATFVFYHLAHIP
jgi:hypothetical protein